MSQMKAILKTMYWTIVVALSFFATVNSEGKGKFNLK